MHFDFQRIRLCRVVWSCRTWLRPPALPPTRPTNRVPILLEKALPKSTTPAKIPKESDLRLTIKFVISYVQFQDSQIPPHFHSSVYS